MSKVNNNLKVKDGNEATSYIAHMLSDVIAIYPITPSSSMAENADEWSAQGKTNIWGQVPMLQEMQSEGGAAAAVHGSIQAGALATTFTASQGLLLMIPTMYKIAGELTPVVFHVSARSLACQALSIFGDHSDVMATRQTGFALLASDSIQAAQDMALIAHAATLESRVPFLHFFDGFRVSHEITNIEELTREQVAAMIQQDLVEAHRNRSLSPDHPVIRGTSQNPDVYFQGRESVNPLYLATPRIVQKFMDQFKKLTGREYRIVEYVGAEDAKQVIVVMGSGAKTVASTVRYLNSQGGKFGMLNVRLFRPFPTAQVVEALPKTVESIAVLDRTKEPGCAGEPLYQDIVTALHEAKDGGVLPMAKMPKIIGGRYGLSSKEFTPAMVKGIFEEASKEKPRNHFTVGIHDDVTNSSIDYDRDFSIESQDMFQGLFYGLGADGTVGANKNSIKIIGALTDNYAQGYFVYDSKKSGSMTVSHIRFGKEPIHAPYLISKANFVACHHTAFLFQINMLKNAAHAATFLVNTPHDADGFWDTLPRQVQEQIIEKQLKVYVIDGYKVARDIGLGRRINTVMQTCFFAISGIVPKEVAIAEIKNTIQKSYGAKGEKIVNMNFAAVDKALENLHEIKVPEQVTSAIEMRAVVSESSPDFVKNVTAKIMSGRGDELPVSAMPNDGTYPTATTQWEKRDLTLEMPVWKEELCIQCGRCSVMCPHAVIRAKIYDKKHLENAPATFKSCAVKGGKEFGEDVRFSLQVSPYDCTGCGVCVVSCPAVNKQNPDEKAINMEAQPPIAKQEHENWEFFDKLPNVVRDKVKANTVKGVQFLQPLFEFSGACAGCGETPYVRLISQLFGDRMAIANATGCSSIYGGNLPTTPWAVNPKGYGPAWSNSLFEDNAEFGFGFRLAMDQHRYAATEMVKRLKDKLPGDLVEALLTTDQSNEIGINAQRENVKKLRDALAKVDDHDAKLLNEVADYLVKKSVWILGGDGWAYDIGYGGLDHVLACGRNVNVLVLDTEVYSNTGGQASKATVRGAVAKLSAAGKRTAKKDLALMAMSYKNVYVARIALAANQAQALKAFIEAEQHDGSSIIIAYSPCIAHGFELVKGPEHQKLAVDSGYWPLARYNPALIAQGKNPFILDSKAPSIPVSDYIQTENRFRVLAKHDPKLAAELAKQLQQDVDAQWQQYQEMAASR